MDDMVAAVLSIVTDSKKMKSGDIAKIHDMAKMGKRNPTIERVVPYVEDVVDMFEKKNRDMLVSDTDILGIAKEVADELISRHKTQKEDHQFELGLMKKESLKESLLSKVKFLN
jgi:hypothetical protein